MWKYSEACAVLFLVLGKCNKAGFNNVGSPVKKVQACFSASKCLESSFHPIGDPMKLAQP